jgi:hypothetical protein
MKLNLPQLIALAMLLALFACLAFRFLMQDNKKQSYRSIVRNGHRRFSLVERISLLFVVPMAMLSSWVHRTLGDNRIALANYLTTLAGDEDTRIADAAIGRRTVVKLGTDADHIDVCGTGDIPIGATRDGSAAIGVRCSFAQFGLYDKELEGTASGAITFGDMLVPGAAGTVRKLPVASGTYYIIGRAKATVADGASVPYVPCFPIQRVV